MSENAESYSSDLEVKGATEVVGECYRELSIYITKTRAYASTVDGLKAVYRRIIYAARNYQKKVKCATLVGESLKFHPHGDASVYDSLVSMTCQYGKFPLFDGKGNFGGLGQGAAGMRYPEAALSKLARLLYLDLIDYADFIDGEAGNREPEYLPAYLPYCLLSGSTSIPTGVPAPSIPPLDALELIDYYIKTLEGDSNLKLPTPDLGDIILDCSRENDIEPLVRTGAGKLWFRGNVIQEGDLQFSVTAETPGCNFWKLQKKVQHLIDQEIIDYTDETSSEGNRHVFRISNPSKLSAKELRSKLEDALKCSGSYKFIAEEDGKAVYCGLDYFVKQSLAYLRKCVRRKYDSHLKKAERALLLLQAIRAFKISKYFPEIVNMTSVDLRNAIESLGFDRGIALEAIQRPISYLTKSHEDEEKSLQKDIVHYSDYLENPDKYLLSKYREIRELVIPIYSRSGHSIVASELESMKPKKAKLEDGSLIISDGEGIRWNHNLYLLSSEGVVTRKYISSRIDNKIDLSGEDHNYEMLASDGGKYLVIILDKHVVVKLASEISGSRRLFKTWDGLKITGCYVTDSESVRFFDERGNSVDYDLADLQRTRVSNPIKITRYDITKVSGLENGKEVGT